jgi:molybdate transport system substrate-binding protein
MSRTIVWIRILSGSALLLVALTAAGTPVAAQLRVVTGNPPEGGVHELAELFERDTGHAVVVENMGGGAINQLLAGDAPADVVIGTMASLEQAESNGQLAGARTPVGRVGIGVIVRGGLPAPDVTNVDALRTAVLDADAVVYNTAGSGQYVDRMLGELGIGEQVRAKNARPGNAAETVQRMFQGSGNEIGFGLVSEMIPYDGREIDFVARLPEVLQNYVVFEAVVLARSDSRSTAADFIRYLTTPAAREVFARHGVD